MADIRELGKRVKSKYPGAYDDMDDAALGRSVKSKYPGQYDDFTDEGPIASQEKPKERGWVDEALDFAKGAVVDTGRSIGHMVERVAKGPQDMAEAALFGTSGPMAPVVRDIIQSHVETGKKAMESFQQGENLQGAGYGLATLLPGVGPAAAGIGEKAAQTKREYFAGLRRSHAGDAKALADIEEEAKKLGEDDTPMPGAMARSAGQAAGLFLAPEIAKRAGPAMGAASDVLKEGAKQEYAQVLGATTKGNKLRSQRVVPELIDRGVTSTTLKGLSEKAKTGADVAGQAISDAFQGLPANSRIPLEPLRQRLAAAAQEDFMLADANGVLKPMSAEAARSVENIKDIYRNISDFAEVDKVTGQAFLPAGTARRLRQYFDEVTKEAGGFEGKNLSDKSVARAHEMGADAIREELSNEFPDIAKLNKEYTFWKNVGQVVGDTMTRKQGQARGLGSKIAGAAGAAGGFGSGGLAGAIVGKYALESLDAITRSPAWRTIYAVSKDRLASALAKGSRGEVEHIIRTMRATMVSSQARSAGQPTEEKKE